MIDERFVYLAVGLDLLGGFTYLIDTLKGKVKPNKVTWFLWAVVPLIGFIAQVSQGVGLVSLLTFAMCIMPMFIFIASFLNKKAYWKITRFDLICGAISVLGVILWGITRIGNLAIIFSMLADFMAAVPSLVKAYKEPETENYINYLLGAIAAFITSLAIKQWNFANYSYPIWTTILCLAFVLLIKFKLGKHLTKV